MPTLLSKMQNKQNNKKSKRKQQNVQVIVQQQGRRRKGGRRAGRTNTQAVPNAFPMSLRNRSRRTCFLDGCDRLLSIPVTADMKAGQVLAQISMTPQAVASLDLNARTWTKYKWDKLKFSIRPQYTTASSGGYIACFIHDPTVVLTLNNSVSAASATSNSVTSNIYVSQNFNVRTKNPKDGYFVTQSQTEPRLSSPGIFALILDTVPSQPGSIIVDVDWAVTLSDRTIEPETETEPILTFTKVVSSIATKNNLLVENGSSDVENFTNWADFPDRDRKKTYYFANPSGIPSWTYTCQKGGEGDSFIYYVRFLAIKYGETFWAMYPCGDLGVALTEYNAQHTSDVYYPGDNCVPADPTENTRLGFSKARSSPFLRPIENSSVNGETSLRPVIQDYQNSSMQLMQQSLLKQTELLTLLVESLNRDKLSTTTQQDKSMESQQRSLYLESLNMSKDVPPYPIYEIPPGCGSRCGICNGTGEMDFQAILDSIENSSGEE